MAWIIRKVNSSPELYLIVDLNGLFAYSTSTSSAIAFDAENDADQLRRVIIDETDTVEI